MGCAAALEVQRIIREDNLVQNVRDNGEYLGKLLREQLADHPHVGDIRGRGFFWSVSQRYITRRDETVGYVER